MDITIYSGHQYRVITRGRDFWSGTLGLRAGRARPAGEVMVDKRVRVIFYVCGLGWNTV